MTAFQGVNLGGWLVLEKWITPSLFVGCDAPDEFGFCDQAGRIRLQQLAKHRKTFITHRDFEWLAAHDVTAVRIPVGYWIFGDQAPYIGAVEYLDKAFEWADKCSLDVFLSLHGAPGSQNGEMHSGRQGSVDWPKSPVNFSKTVKMVERLAMRYKNSPRLAGIGVLNEPAGHISHATLKQYYKQAYRSVRRICGPKVRVVITDLYNPEQWNWSFRWPLYRNLVLDSHQYQIFSDDQRAMPAVQHVQYTKSVVTQKLAKLHRHHKLIIGEWSGALDPSSLIGVAQTERQQAYRDYIAAQVDVYSRTDGWFYWTYRHETSDIWSYRVMVEKGLLASESM